MRHLDKVGMEIRRAQRVIGAVLGLARGEAVTLEPTHVAALLDGARRAIVLPTNVTFSVSIEPPDLVIRCDAILMERVLANLYLNAIEALASRGRGAVGTDVRRTGDRVEVVVHDDGPGIEPDVARTVFDPLITTKPSGMGLGLALCRAIVKAHGGEISAHTKTNRRRPLLVLDSGVSQSRKRRVVRLRGSDHREERRREEIGEMGRSHRMSAAPAVNPSLRDAPTSESLPVLLPASVSSLWQNQSPSSRRRDASCDIPASLRADDA